MTIRHLVTHSFGLEDAEEDGKSHRQLTGWKDDFWRREPDPFFIAIHGAPVLFEPGSRFAYSNPGVAALAYAVTLSLKETPYRDIRTLLRKRIMEPIGLRDQAWSVGYGTTYEVDGLPLVTNWGGGRVYGAGRGADRPAHAAARRLAGRAACGTRLGRDDDGLCGHAHC